MSRLADPRWLAGKAGLSAGLAVAIVQLADIPDGVSAAFVATVCTAPTVWSGIKRARDQALASLLGALGAAGLAWLGLPAPIGVTLAVILAISSTWAASLAHAYPVASFTAIYMLLLPKGSPETTLEVRLLAVSAGALAALSVNFALSWSAVRQVFRKRLARADGILISAIRQLPRQPGAIRRASQDLDTLGSELADALREAQMLRRPKRIADLAELGRRLDALRLVAHLACDLTVHRDLLKRHDAERWIERLADAMQTGATLPSAPVADLQRLAVAVAAWQGQCSVVVGEIH